MKLENESMAIQLKQKYRKVEEILKDKHLENENKKLDNESMVI